VQNEEWLSDSQEAATRKLATSRWLVATRPAGYYLLNGRRRSEEEGTEEARLSPWDGVKSIQGCG
jgi:hypothetical protein